MAVIHLIETAGPGGAETVMAELVVRGRSDLQRALAVIPSMDGWLGRTLPVSAQRVVGPTPNGASAPIDVAYLRALRNLFHAERPLIVHAHSFDSAFYSALAVQGLSIKLVATFHGTSDIARHGFRNRLKWTALRRADAIVCVSRSLAELARETRGVPVDRVRTIMNGVNLAQFTEERSPALRVRLGLDASTLLIGALGNLRPVKGYHLLLPALAQLHEKGARIHLAIAGDDRGPLASQLRQQASALGLHGCVTLLGYQDDPAAFLRGIDFFVLPSTSEGFSLSTVQAMASALPIVATRCGGPEELITHDEHGWLVAAGSSEALAAGIGSLLSDGKRCARYAAAARARAIQMFSLETMVASYDDLYVKLLGA